MLAAPCCIRAGNVVTRPVDGDHPYEHLVEDGVGDDTLQRGGI